MKIFSRHFLATVIGRIFCVRLSINLKISVGKREKSISRFERRKTEKTKC